MRVLFYGLLADAIGGETETSVPRGCSVGELRENLRTAHPAAAADIVRSRAIVSATAVPDDFRIGAGEVVEFLPPVSGG